MDLDNAIKNIGGKTAYEWIVSPTTWYWRVSDLIESGKVRENWFYSQEDAVKWLVEIKTIDANIFDGMALELKQFILV